MASEDAKCINRLVSIICQDRLQRHDIKDKISQIFLTKVTVPCGWQNTGYRLHENCPSYKYRLEILKKFIERKKSEGFESLTSETSKQFFEELRKFSADSGSTDSFPESIYADSRRKPQVDLFEQNIRLQGVVVQKFSKDLKASVLIKTEDCGKQQGHGSAKSSPSELVVKLQDEGDLVEGDVVEVTKCKRREGEAWEPEVIKCYYLSEAKIESILNLVSDCLQRDGSTAAVTEITRCRAAWNYILELSVESYSTRMTCQILEIIDKISSSARMSHSVNNIVKGFQQSEFFRTVLPDFINKMTELHEKSCFSLVQKILEHVITVVPEAGLQVLPMATVLACNLVKASSDFEAAKENGQSAVVFIAELSKIIAAEVPGACKDLKVLSWKDLPLIPDEEEIKKPRLKTDDLPVINDGKEKKKYESEEKYLDTYFRLLREECFYKLRKGISDFVANGQKCDSKDMMMYRIFLRGASTRHEYSPTVMLISLEYEVLETQFASECENTSWFLYGNLLCMSLDGSFQEPVWAVVERHIAEQSIIKITLCNKANALSEPQFIAKMQEITDRNESAFMAESQTFYLSFAPAMEVLQHRDHVPFKEFLVDADPSHMEPAAYISEIKTPPDWGIIFHKDSLPQCSDEPTTGYSLLEEFDALRFNGNCKSILDDSQLTAVELALKSKLALIQGPPGTGKSYVGVALVNLLLSMHVPEDHGPILVVTYKNHALNNFLKDCLTKVSSPDVKIVRVGRLDDADDGLRKCLLREVGRHWPPRLYYQKRKLLGQIWALQPKVRDAFENLRSSSIFSADMFLKEASKEQLKFLVLGSEAHKVTEEQMDKLIKEQPRNKTKLKELVEDALNEWLPSQEVFDDLFGVKEKGSSTENSSSGKEKQTKKEDQDQLENPNDFKDPSVEQKERLLALDEEIADEEDREIAKEEDKEIAERKAVGSVEHPWLRCRRNLVCIDESKVKPFRSLLDSDDVWKLDVNERVQLVYVFQNNFYAKASSEFLDVSKDYAQLHHQLKELTNQHDIEVMKRCHVIGMTVTGATMRANLLADIKPSVMIVEEAAEILEGQLVAVIPPSVQHLIMIGDHMQLKPMVHFHRLKKHHHLDLSMFERLVNCNLPFRQLEYQCRMRDEFVDLLRELKIYKELKTNEKLVRGNERPSCVTSSMYFWTHTAWESESKPSHSKRNFREAKEITGVAKTFCQEGRISPSKITVLCSYRGQVDEIKDHFRKTEVAALNDITVTTIDSFQGQENDIILISLVRSNQLTQGKIGYLSSMNRLCVAISRARCGLYLFGNHAHLAGASKKGWKVVSDFMRKKRCLGPRFPFCSSEDSKRQWDGNSPTREAESPQNVTYHIDVRANQANVNVGGDNSVNTINTNPVHPPVMTSSPRLDIPSAGSWKTPVHDPMSPSPEYVPSTVSRSPTQEAEKEAREPMRESGEHDNEEHSPAQEAGSPTREASEPIQELGKPNSEAESPTKEARDPVHEVGKPSNEMEALTKEASESIQEVGKPNSEVETPIEDIRKSVQEVGKPTKEADAPTKEARVAIQEAAKPTKEAGSPTKEATEPIQEVGKPNMQSGSPTKEARESIQEVGKPSKEAEEGRTLIPEAGSPTQGDRVATHYAGQPTQEVLLPTKDTGSAIQEAVPPDKETREPIQEASTSTKETGLPAQETPGGKTIIDTADVENRTELRVVEADSSEVWNKSTKEDALPTQETMAAGKGPFEETGNDEGKARQETGIQSEPQAVDRDKTKQVMEDKEVLQGEVSQRETQKKSESMKVETEISKEEALPTQETMAAGKGPFEETSLEVGVKGQATDGQE